MAIDGVGGPTTQAYQPVGDTSSVDKAQEAPEPAQAPEASEPAATGYSGQSSFEASNPAASAANFFGWGESKPAELKPVIGPAVNKLLDGLKSNRPPELDPAKAEWSGKDEGVTYDKFKTGDNTTTVPRDGFESPSITEAQEQREATKAAQEKVAADMKDKLGRDVKNPPSLDDAQEYFKKVAGNGTDKEVDALKQKYADYTSAYYAHAGSGSSGVDWGAKGDLANNLDKALAGQPTLKDGRKVIDCEGYAALTERMLGGIQNPKTGQPMFDLQQVQTAGHIMTGVFRHGDPSKDPFVVNNNQVQSIPPEDVAAAKALAKGGQINTEAGREFIARRAYDRYAPPSAKGTAVSAPTFAESRAKLDRLRPKVD